MTGITQLKPSKVSNMFSKLYLIIYNLVQFCGFSYIFFTLASLWLHDGNVYRNFYPIVGPLFLIFQALQLLEILHTLLGLTRGSALFPFIQINGRLVVLYLLIEKMPHMHQKQSVFFLLLVYSIVECIRYPYYLSSLMKLNIKPLTVLRYTAWIPLYPAGIFLEAVVACQNLAKLDQTGKYSYPLPNALNWSFHMPSMLRFYLAVLIWPLGYTLMSHMYRQMKKTLSK